MTPLALAVLIAAAPVPKKETDAARLVRLFGEPVDHAGGSKFDMAGDKLTITVPKDVRRVIMGHPLSWVPHTVREVSGDFQLSVTVTCKLPDAPRPREDGSNGYQAGLLLDGGNDLRAWHTKARRVGGIVDGQTAVWSAAHHPAGGNAAQWIHERIRPETPLQLRLSRRGPVIGFEFRFDHRPWATLKDNADTLPGLPDKVSVGVFAQHDTADGFTATFEDFRIDPLPAEGRQ